jgi:MFS family permease
MSEEQVAPTVAPDQGPPARSSNALAIAGWITAVLVPLPVGMVIGGILASRDDKRGKYILGVSIGIAVIWIVSLVLILNAAEHQAVRSYYEEPY